MDIEAYRKKFNETNIFAKSLGITITKLTEGYAEAELITAAGHSNVSGSLHGGVLFSLADATTGAASKSYGFKTVTLEGKINYIRPVSTDGKRIKAIAQVRHAGRTTSVYNCDIWDENQKLIATLLFTFFTLPERLE